MAEFIVAALTFGLAAGLQPGPLGVLVVHHALRGGFRAGARAAMAPLVSDGPILLLAVTLLPRLGGVDGFTAGLGLVGGAYLFWLGGGMLRIRHAPDFDRASGPTRGALRTAVRVNLLNPNPWLFWFSVGGSYILRGSRGEAAAFVLVMLAALIGAKMLLAGLAASARPFLLGSGYGRVIRLLGVVLLGFGGKLLWQAWLSLGRAA